jgi:hypothetical protein
LRHSGILLPVKYLCTSNLSDVTIGEGVKVLDDLDQIVAGVSAPRAEEEKPEEVDELEGEEAAEGDEAKDEEASKSSDDSSE